MRRSFTNIFGNASSVDPERRNAVLLIGGISLVVVFAFFLIAYGYYTDRVEPRRENVLRVGDRHFNYAYVERRIESDVARGLFDPSDIQNSITQSLARLQREELIRIIAKERGVTASQEDIDAGIRATLGLGGDVTHDEMASILRREMIRIKLPLDDYLETIEADVLRDKVEAQFTDPLPAESEQVNLNLIAAGSQSNAILAKQALDAGQPFADVAKQYSQDESASAGGAFGWSPKELLDPELAGIAFSISGRSDVIETTKDFYIIEVLDKQVREVTREMKIDIGNQEFQALLEVAFNNTILVYNLKPEQVQSLANRVGAAIPGG